MLEGDDLWDQLTSAFGKQKPLWSEHEKAENPGTIDKVIHYAIAYADRPISARNAVRLFNGVGDTGYFSGWNEVRVATTREVAETLKQAGIQVNDWDLANNIREFLHHTWSVLSTMDLDEVQSEKPKVLDEFLSKSPLRPKAAMDYLKALWGRTDLAPYEAYTDRILCRLGLVSDQDTIAKKSAVLQTLISGKKPLVYHKKLIQLAKTVCLLKEPRCNICPLNKRCDYVKNLK